MNDTNRKFTCLHVIGSSPFAGAQTISIEGGAIASIEPAPVLPADGLLAFPALVNAHDHGRAIRTSSIGADAKPLESWLHYLALFPRVDPYLAAAINFANNALGGAGTVMVHYTRTQGFTKLPEEAAEVARAARDVGVRAGFAVSMKDRNPLVYGPTEPILGALTPEARAEIERQFLWNPPSPDEYLALAGDVAAAAGCYGVDVQYGPNGVQWCTKKLLEAVAEASHRTGRRVHMHLLETRYQRQWLDAEYPDGVVHMLDSIGLLSPRLTLAHCVWARPDELELLAERGVIISVNTSSNLHLHSGIAPVQRMTEKRCRIALGIDGKALDDDDDSLRELRLSYLLHAGSGFQFARSRREALQAAVRNGRYAVTNVDELTILEPGASADMLLLNWAAFDDDGLCDGIDPVNLFFSRATAKHIGELVIGGRTIVKNGHVSGIDLPSIRNEVLAQMRSGMAGNMTLRSAIAALEKAVASHYLSDPPCC
jgi:cytosine/adenosine deaminase-related metal-dependent hydrolase